MRYAPEAEAAEQPNVVVDGSPNGATVLTLSHWPGMPAPAHTWADTSAEMVLRYLDAGAGLHGDAEVATNNHFDQDGLAGLFALTDPDAALPLRVLVADLARAGDFAVYADRRAARASMAVTTLSGYEEGLALIARLLDHPERFEHLWRDEDAVLAADEDAVANGRVDVREVADLDLAVVVVDPSVDSEGGHRFAHRHARGLHPMALHGATACCRLLVAHGDAIRYTDRYETWVQYRSRPLPQRVDLAPLAEELTALDDGVEWSATGPGDLTPELTAQGSSLPFDRVAAVVERHLRTAPPAWNPYDITGSRR